VKNVFWYEPLPPVCVVCVTEKKKDREGTLNSRVARWRKERRMGPLLSGTERQWERGGERERKRRRGAGGGGQEGSVREWHTGGQGE